jgi:hypothetical protein
MTYVVKAIKITNLSGASNQKHAEGQRAQMGLISKQTALETLCRTYWRPIYGFVRRQGVGPEEAKELTQGFFALLLERRDLNTVRQEKGRLRSYLLTSISSVCSQFALWATITKLPA